MTLNENIPESTIYNYKLEKTAGVGKRFLFAVTSEES